MTILISLDCEASGPCPNHGDLLSFGAVVVDSSVLGNDWNGFYSDILLPACDKYDDGAYKAINITREQHLNATKTIKQGILEFKDWLDLIPRKPNERLVMITDNPGFDFGWMNYELHNHLGYNPLGHSARRIGDAYCGLKDNMRNTQGWKKLRDAPHDHNPLNDCLGNAQAWVKLWPNSY